MFDVLELAACSPACRYAANGLKSDFNGNNNRHTNNVYGYVGNCWGTGSQDWFVNNDCFANSDSGGFRSDCNPGDMQIWGNRFYNREGESSTKLCNASNTLAKLPDDDAIIAAGMAKCTLGLASLARSRSDNSNDNDRS